MVAPLSDGGVKMVEEKCNHRLFRAAQEGKLYIKAHILNETEMEKYIMN